jgi:DNA-binding CsgD family transcriptional regulator
MSTEAPVVFVGRSDELAALSAALESARNLEPRVVFIEAESGMGKTSLVRQFLAKLDDVAVCRAAGDESEISLEYGVVAQLASEIDDSFVGRLPLLASGPRPSADPFSVGGELLQAFGLIQERGSVLVIVLDDLQWADVASARALLFTLRRLGHDRVLVVVSARPAATHILGESWQRFLRDESRVHRLQLGGLETREIQELATALGVDRLPTLGADRLGKHTGGHPLYLRALFEELPRDALMGGVDSLPAPRSLALTVVSRLAVLSDTTQRLVGAAAVLGERCPLRLAVALAELGDDTDSLEQAVDARLLERSSRMSVEEVSFVHPLLRAAVYADLSPTRRQDLHRKAARLVQGSASLSHRVAATTQYDDELAEELERTAQAEEAQDLTSAATDHLLMAADLGSTESAREARFLAAIHVMILGGNDARAQSMKDAVEKCADGPAKSYALGALELHSGRIPEAEALFMEALEAPPVRSHASFRGRAALSLALIFLARADGEAASRWSRYALDHADGDVPVAAFALSSLAGALATAGDLPAALAVLDPPSPELAKPPTFEANKLSARGRLRLLANDLQGAVEDLSASLRWSRSGTPLRRLASVYATLANAQYRIGFWDQAVVNAEVAVSLAQDIDWIPDLPMVHAFASYLNAGLGDWESSEAHAREARNLSELVPSPWGTLYAAQSEATLARERGDFQSTLDALHPLLDDPLRTFLERSGVVPWRILHVEALLGLGRLEEAERVITEIEGMALVRDPPAARLEVLRLRGAIEDAKGNGERAQRALAEGDSLAAQHELPFGHALLEITYGRSLRRTGQRREAVTHLRSARQTFATMRARPYIDACDAELTALGAHSTELRSAGGVSLTPREQSVAHLVTSGLSNPEVAAELYVSTKTVEYHLGNIFSKLNISSRRQLQKALADMQS